LIFSSAVCRVVSEEQTLAAHAPQMRKTYMNKRHLLRWVTLAGVLLAVVLLFSLNLLSPTPSVRSKAPALPLSQGMGREDQLAQDLALSDTRVQAYTVGRRSEVFSVVPVQYHVPAAASTCYASDCRQVNIFNWDENAAVTAFVDIAGEQVLDVLYQPQVHPGINQRAVDLARQLVVNDRQTAVLLGYELTESDLDMPPMEGDAPGTSCDGSHICVAYNFDYEDYQVLWVWVDLTDEVVAGYRTTRIIPGDIDGPPTFIPEGCPSSGTINRDGWTMNHEVTGSDGLRVFNVAYNGIAVATSIKNAEWHADYGSTGYRDATGCSPSGGFPIYPYGNTVVADILDGQNVIGFQVIQDFRMGNWGNSCNYRYEQRMQFFVDGRFRTVLGAYGKGCGTNAIYRPLTRVDIAVAGDPDDTFALWDGNQWADQSTELYRTPYAGPAGPHAFDANGYAWRVTDASGAGYYLQPSQDNTFGDGGRGDNPFIYAVLHRPSEGDSDLGGLGDCCRDDHEQGPHIYVNGENIASQNIVLWYVPQMITDAAAPDYYCWTISGEPNPETYPCFAGPMFVPVDSGQAAAASFTSNSPVLVGDLAEFTNASTGTPPLSFAWDFGDGVGSSSDEHPTYLYGSSGVYTVTLTTSNAFGSSEATGVFEVLSSYWYVYLPLLNP
jgi:hypothetical protein